MKQNFSKLIAESSAISQPDCSVFFVNGSVLPKEDELIRLLGMPCQDHEKL